MSDRYSFFVQIGERYVAKHRPFGINHIQSRSRDAATWYMRGDINPGRLEQITYCYLLISLVDMAWFL